MLFPPLGIHITQLFTYLLGLSLFSKLGFDVFSDIPIAHMSSIVILKLF